MTATAPSKVALAFDHLGPVACAAAKTLMALRCGMVTEIDKPGLRTQWDHWKCKLRIRAAMMLLWKSAGTGHYGYSGEIPVAVVYGLLRLRDLGHGRCLWVRPRSFRRSKPQESDRAGAEHRIRPRKHGGDGASWLRSLRLKEKRHVAWSRRKACLRRESGCLNRERPALSISVMLCATTGSFSMSRMRLNRHGSRESGTFIVSQPNVAPSGT